MNTQNLEYSEDVKAFPLVADAFKLRDDAQEEVDTVNAERDRLRGLLGEQDDMLEHYENLCTIADDKLALVATMAQDQIDAIEKVSQEFKGSDAHIKSTITNLLKGIEGVVNDGNDPLETFENAFEVVNGLFPLLGDEPEEVQEELDLSHVAA